MLAAFRSTVVEHLEAAALQVDGHVVDVWRFVPEDVTALPCIVVGYPEAAPARETAVFDRSLVVYVLGRRVDVGDVENELVALVDAVVSAFGGTNGVRTTAAQRVAFTRTEHRSITVAGVDHDGYLVHLESPYADC